MNRVLWALKNVFRRERVDRDLDAEVRSYRTILEDEHMAKGLQPPDARRAANLNLGSPEQLKESVRDVRAGAWLESLWRDLIFAARVLRKSPGFTSVAVLTLAIGIGATVAMFSLVYGVLLQPLPYPDSDRLAFVYMHFSPQNSERGTMCIADYLDWKSQNRTFEDPQIYSNRSLNITGIETPQQVAGAAVTAGFFSTLRVNAFLGRVFLPGEDAPAAAKMAVIGESLWHRRFSGDSSVVGRSVVLNGSQFTIVGVMPASFQFPQRNTEIWTNLQVTPPTRRGPFFYRGLGRLKPGVTLAQAQADTNAVGIRIAQQFPYYKNLTLPVLELREAMVGRMRFALVVMFGAVVFVLLIAAVNISNLLSSRAAVRAREMAVRLSLGASRFRLVRQLLIESLLLSVIGAAAGTFLAWAAIASLRRLDIANGLPRVQDVSISAPVLLFSVAVCIATGLLFGLLPSLKISRANVSASLNEGGRSRTQSGAHRRTNSILVVAEVAMSLVLLVGAGLLLRSFNRLQRVDPGFEAPAESVVIMSLSPNLTKYQDDKIGLPYLKSVLEKVQNIPGVEFAALSDSLPPDRLNDYDTFVIEGRALPGGQQEPAIPDVTVTPDYFRALGIPVRAGRAFDERDTSTSPPVTIVSESFARQYFPNENPVGRRIKASGTGVKSPYMEIVGVVADTKYWGLDQKKEAAYYLPLPQNYGNPEYLLVRSKTDSAAELAGTVRSEIAPLDRDTIIGNVATLDDAMSRSVAQPRFRTDLLAAFSLIALLLAAIGVYGVISYSVTQRTNEIGIRVALGAQRRDVFRQILGSGLRLALLGSAIGLAFAFALTRYLSTLLFGVQPHDLATFASTAFVLIAVAAIACWIPAHRAMNVDPMVALRHE